MTTPAEFSTTSVTYTVAFEGVAVPGQFDIILDVGTLGDERTHNLTEHVEAGLRAFAEHVQQADGITLVRAFRFTAGAISGGDVINGPAPE